MVLPGLLLLIGALAALASGVFLRERRLRLAAADMVAGSSDRLAGFLRFQRLTAGELRGVAVTLLGHSQATTHPSSDVFDGVAHKLIGISDDLLRRGVAPEVAHVIEAEIIELVPVLEFAVSQIAAGLGPGKRAWRIGSIPDKTMVFADRRALNQILVTVLSSAATSTREGDWIDVSLHTNDHAWQLRIEDEGTGLAVGRGNGRGSENRGMGYGLTLARSLMHAHGGQLEVQSTAQIGTSVRLIFPAGAARA